MKYDFDIIVIGLGPAGMATSAMGAEMGLRVCAIEKNKIGGECMNVGCIPSKGLLQAAKIRHLFTHSQDYGLDYIDAPKVLNPLALIRGHVKYINENKTKKMFEKVHLILGQGEASFVDSHTVQVGAKKITAKRFFITVGTKPALPPIPGLTKIDILTNENLFDLNEIPSSLTIIGGGAIGVEMAQAFSRLGSKVTIVHMDAHLIPHADKIAGDLIETVFQNENIRVLNGRLIKDVRQTPDGVLLVTDKGEEILSTRVLVAAGRRQMLESLKLENAGVEYDKCGIKVDKYLRTNVGHIFAPGDCNGHFLFSHAAMHQGMIALMNTLLPWPFKKKFRNYPVPWTIFSDPNVSTVGLTELQLREKRISYEVIESRYEDYGAAIAEGLTPGFVRVYATKTGKILGALVIGEGSAEMINEWALAIQKGIRLYDIMLTMHSFPSMSFLNKRISEMWMMNRMKSDWIKKIIRLFF